MLKNSIIFSLLSRKKNFLMPKRESLAGRDMGVIADLGVQKALLALEFGMCLVGITDGSASNGFFYSPTYL
jgi:hypothetical protein